MIKLAIANQKGGVGKTTTAIVLADILQNRGYKVLFVDCDAQCNSSGYYGAVWENESTMLDILCGDEKAEECIQHTEKGDIIPSDKELKDAENMVKVDERRFTHLKRSLRGVEKKYDFAVFDTPPHVGVCLKNVLSACDHIIVPIEETGWSITGLLDFTEAIDLAKDNNEDLDVLGILTVKTKPRTRKSGRMAGLSETVAEQLGTTCFETKIRESVKCAEALTEYYVPLSEYAPESTSYQDYTAFTDELLEKLGITKQEVK